MSILHTWAHLSVPLALVDFSVHTLQLSYMSTCTHMPHYIHRHTHTCIKTCVEQLRSVVYCMNLHSTVKCSFGIHLECRQKQGCGIPERYMLWSSHSCVCGSKRWWAVHIHLVSRSQTTIFSPARCLSQNYKRLLLFFVPCTVLCYVHTVVSCCHFMNMHSQSCSVKTLVQ